MIALFIILHTGNKSYKKKHGINIRWYTDSDACVYAWRNQKSSSPRLNAVIVWIASYCSARSILVDAVHIKRELNQAADALTHDDTTLFSQLTGINPSRRRSPDSHKLNSQLSRLLSLDGQL